MTIHRARMAMRRGDIASAIELCQLYTSVVDPPYYLLEAALDICKKARQSLDDNGIKLYYSSSLDETGAPLALFSLVENRSLQKDSFAIAYTSTGPLASKFSSLQGFKGLYMLCVESHWSKNTEDLRNEALKLAIYLLSANPSEVFVNTTRGFVVASACRIAGIPYSWWIHEAEPAFSFIEELSLRDYAETELRACPAKFFVSAETKQRYIDECSLDEGSCGLLIPNLIRRTLREAKATISSRWARQALGINEDIIILSVGTLCPRKAQIDIIDAFIRLPTDVISRCILLFVGSGNADKEYYQKALACIAAAKESIPHLNIRIDPPSSKIYLYYISASLYVHASLRECFCQAMLEAQFFGLPIIYKACEGMAEVLSIDHDASCYTDTRQLPALLEEAICLRGGH